MKKIAAMILALPILTNCGVEQVNEGYRGIKQVWGKVEQQPLGPGLYFYNPFSSDIFEMDVREQKLQKDEECFTKDTQTVNISMAVTYFPQQEKIAEIYSQFGEFWPSKIVEPVIAGTIKDVIGQYVADDLVSKREVARIEALKHLKSALEPRSVNVTRLDFINLDFNDTYEHAVEAKVVAVQRAAEAKNKTVQVKEESDQIVLKAKADAEAMKIKSQAISQNKNLVEYEAVQKWDGQLPQYMFGNSTPFINIKEK